MTSSASDIALASSRPVRATAFVALALSVLAISWAAPLIRFTDANAIAISFWRLLISLPLIACIVSVFGQWGQIRVLQRRQWLIAGAAGLLLALHFATWIASVQFTTVAASVALVSTQPVWVAILGALLLGEHPRRSQWIGIGLAVAGAAVIGWGDFQGGSRPFLGDLLALVGALAVAGYYVIGRSLRARLDVWPYVMIVYGVATVALLPALVVGGIPIVAGYSQTDWLVFLALALGPMMIGHTGQNYALGFLPAHTVNLTLLGEPVGATLIAWMLPAIAEVPPGEPLIGGGLILSGILLGLRRR